MDIITRFVSADGTISYSFPNESQTTFSDNLRDAVPATTRAIGISGGVDQYGTGRAPTEIGSARVAWWLFGDTPAQMDAKLLLARQMTEYGLGYLYRLPQGSTVEQFTRARINNLNIPYNVQNLPHAQFRVEAIWQMPDPHWYAIGTESARYGSGIYGSSKYGAGGASYAISGTSTSGTFTTVGIANTLPRLLITTSASQTASDIRIQRLVGTTVIDQVRYNATIGASATLEINCRAKSVTLNGTNVFTSAFTYQTADWMSMIPGANSLRVLLTNPSDACTLKVYAYDAYR